MSWQTVSRPQCASLTIISCHSLSTMQFECLTESSHCWSFINRHHNSLSFSSIGLFSTVNHELGQPHLYNLYKTAAVKDQLMAWMSFVTFNVQHHSTDTFASQMSVSGCPLIVLSSIKTRPSCYGSDRGTVCLNMALFLC